MGGVAYQILFDMVVSTARQNHLTVLKHPHPNSKAVRVAELRAAKYSGVQLVETSRWDVFLFEKRP